VGQTSYRTTWEVIDASREIRVGKNTDLELSSLQYMEREGCLVLTSAAFYNDVGDPLGLLVSQGQTLSSWQGNQLFNGVVGVTTGGILQVTRDGNEHAWDWAVQAGPVVYEAFQPASLSLAADQPARRVVAVVTTDDKLVLTAIVAEDSLFYGPELRELPEVLQEWQTATGITIKAALNLDGGTASAFLSPTFKLKELKPVGSFICVE